MEAETRAPARQETLLAALSCYYPDENGRPERPQCQTVAVVAYGGVVLCAMCTSMRSAGRQVARKVPGAELGELIEAARELGLAEERVNQALQGARLAGASWGQIGDALGITRQAAQQRFAAVDRSEDRRVT